jgi:uncharacterized membrane protein YobD (UPF0266 family)
MTPQRRRFRLLSRDTVIFTLGVLVIVYETVFDHADKPTLIVLAAAMIGLPAFLHQDEAARKPKIDPPKEDKIVK